MHRFTPPLSLAMEVGVLQGPRKVKGLQQECERHHKPGALVGAEKNVSVATDVFLAITGIAESLGKAICSSALQTASGYLNSEYFSACNISRLLAVLRCVTSTGGNRTLSSPHLSK